MSFSVVLRRASTFAVRSHSTSLRQTPPQPVGDRLGWSRNFAALGMESVGDLQISNPNSMGHEVASEQNVRVPKVKEHKKKIKGDATDVGASRPPVVKGAVFREWCKAVAVDTYKMAVNEAEAKMKSKAGVIGRSEGGDLGMKLDSGYISPHFVTDTKTDKCELEDPLILIHEKKLYSTDAVEKLVELAQKKQRPLLIVAEDVGNDSLSSLILSKLSSGVKVCAIKAPGFGDNRKSNLQNLAAICGGEIITEELGVNIDAVEPDMLGTCKKVVISKGNTVIIEGAGATKPTQEMSAEEKDIEMVKMHSEESEFLLKHLQEEELSLERRQTERLHVIFKKFVQETRLLKKRKKTKRGKKKTT